MREATICSAVSTSADQWILQSIPLLSYCDVTRSRNIDIFTPFIFGDTQNQHQTKHEGVASHCDQLAPTKLGLTNIF